MTVIRQNDLIDSVADALQFIACYHPRDFIQSLYEAYQREENPAAKEALAQILINSRLSAIGKRPMCQDTGIVTVFAEIGMGVRFEGEMTLDEMINEGVRRAYTCPSNRLRYSVVADPDGSRKNTGDNTPAIIHHHLVAGDQVKLRLAAKGGGSEAKTRFAMLNPSDSVVDWVLEQIPHLGAGWCPPGIIGIGIGGNPEKAMEMAKSQAMESIDIHQLQGRGAQNHEEALRLELYRKINELGIGAQGLGGLTTVLDVKIESYPTHAANKPIALVPNCAATRHIEITLDGHGAAIMPEIHLDDWPEIAKKSDGVVRRVNIDDITKEEMADWKAGDSLLLSGKILTGRDAAHKRLVDLLDQGQALPVDLENRFIYYVGPVDPVKGEVMGPAGPTTATRMDKFTPRLLAETGLIGMIGKAERGEATIKAIRDNKAAYLIAVGGAAYLISKAIKSARILAFEDLGMEAIYEFEVEDMPVTVAVDSDGQNIHKIAPKKWQAYIQEKACSACLS
ncbi:iron-dependent fumarate hydratase [Zymomonas mobilis subsp. mobilis ZM4 = ATCC 31821]|uniref:Fumarate hydratase class I n=1 Tax=Zymomonas mobilis subsp. mobilis (strain ATCC 31821 / ZM4 / CP4) TaxID=264203 RepID=Q5NMX9_ZYMMO|nr:fumarate hydratase [Zymomonas mobilis]AAV89931.1 hydro-lyase, Fe-S type, tartrate/fumarate subfamily, alpha subunit [Zymomonas mobilis subsp. mobilis ZM4 = ATCC 31821]AVZ26178.1 iron-dependent fumarate hydratase [Zymomonas mobilis subsp. mobilis]AVZ42510.1 iron-dependent fumarate hydratase [Zymomonas mobilis subsp. mobilis ZM4 = ATCC 31821]UBQ07279.1 fumarate hydratase [Zymomonas mobilis]HCE37019.1 fumarate hydratase [Zymomonas mobilis]